MIFIIYLFIFDLRRFDRVFYPIYVYGINWFIGVFIYQR